MISYGAMQVNNFTDCGGVWYPAGGMIVPAKDVAISQHTVK